MGSRPTSLGRDAEHYNYFRDYEASLGRFLQSDPIGLKGGINIYSYVGSRPLNLFDARGLTWNMEFPGPGDVPPNEGLKCVANVRDRVWGAAGSGGWRGNDKLLHCVVSCEAAKECGQYVTRHAGRGRELYQLIGQGKGFDPAWRNDSMDDEVANRFGRLCEPKKDCLTHCRNVY